jgi:hypothetical protein
MGWENSDLYSTVRGGSPLVILSQRDSPAHLLLKKDAPEET